MARINITLPVFNEEAQLSSSVAKLLRFIEKHREFDCEIIIANNGSTDRTLDVARELETSNSIIKVINLKRKGRGRALKLVWTQSAAQFMSYMDIDLSTDLSAFPLLIDALVSDHFDLAVGTRLHRFARVKRGWKREIISRVYNRLVTRVLGTTFSDAQCGFKAVNRDVVERLLPVVHDNYWFFDTELLAIAEKSGYRTLNIPVKWADDPDSRVKLISTALNDLKGLFRLRRRIRQGAYAGLKARLLTNTDVRSAIATQ